MQSNVCYPILSEYREVYPLSLRIAKVWSRKETRLCFDRESSDLSPTRFLLMVLLSRVQLIPRKTCKYTYLLKLAVSIIYALHLHHPPGSSFRLPRRKSALAVADRVGMIKGIRRGEFPEKIPSLYTCIEVELYSRGSAVFFEFFYGIGIQQNFKDKLLDVGW